MSFRLPLPLLDVAPRRVHLGLQRQRLVERLLDRLADDGLAEEEAHDVVVAVGQRDAGANVLLLNDLLAGALAGGDLQLEAVDVAGALGRLVLAKPSRLKPQGSGRRKCRRIPLSR
jgi:hypothetical protein